ncbi:hypothetical protein TWF694_009565 [Orbilia ellipsospora]|uniref:Uncharacterized protein n=1 Tax=Orbilia ellipsospora TaxID=2528407 RepID=A0AAV9XE88_9PEZI
MSSSSKGSQSPTSSTPSKLQLIVKLKLPSDLLRQFQPSSPTMSTPSKPASIADDEKLAPGATSPATVASPVPTPSVASPAPTGPGSPPNLEGKAVNGVVEAVKRGGKRAGTGGGKPGPKKRKLDDGSSHPPSRLGPKASGGAINAGLRALDRSGNPCKKWSKAPLSFKSFTGFQFTLKVYGSPIVKPPVEEPKEGLNVPASDAASFVSANQSDVGTPKEEIADPNGATPMEDVRSTNGEEKSTQTVTGGVNGLNGVHVSTPGGTLVAPV